MLARWDTADSSEGTCPFSPGNADDLPDEAFDEKEEEPADLDGDGIEVK
jgi:hypothetical protein